jgi:fructokinase
MTKLRVGIDLGGTKIEGIAIDPTGRELARTRVMAPRDVYADTVAAIAELVTTVEREAGGRAPAVGVGIPGMVSPATGLVKNANSTWLIGHPLDKDLAKALGRPVRLENDANCFTVSEASDGAAAGAKVVFGVILGTGCGGGLVVDGKPITGHNAIAGEWGHNPLPWRRDSDGPAVTCWCGKPGCLETVLSGPAFARDFATAHPDAGKPEPAAIVEKAEAGDRKAQAALERYAEQLGRALATILNLFDPDVIVLGGGMSNVKELYGLVPKHWSDWAFSDQIDTRLVQALHGDSSGVRGAAWLWPA